MAKKYNEKYYARYGDPRTADWLLMDNQLYPFLFGAGYFIFTRCILPLLMRNRNPWQLRKVTFAYNFGMMFLNVWLFYEFGGHTVRKPNFNWICQPIDWSNTAEALKEAELGWIFFTSTLIESVATVLIVLRKRDTNLSVNHTFYRIQAPIAAWYGLKFAPGGYNSLYGFLCTFVNIVFHFNQSVLVALSSRHRHMWNYIAGGLFFLMQCSILIWYTQLYIFPPKGCKLSFFILRLNMGSAILYFVFQGGLFVSKPKNKNTKIDSSKSSEKLT